MHGGMPHTEAASKIARVFNNATVDSDTIENWREQILRGVGRGAPEYAVKSFYEFLPMQFYVCGLSPLERGEILLKALGRML
jgi:hypothetical protein